MMITHKIEIDLTNPGPTPRIQVKQGDTLSRRVQIQLFTDGEAWAIPADVKPAVRYHVHDLDGTQDSTGIYDTLPDGSDPFQFTQNNFYLLTVPQMFTQHGIVTTDVVFIQGSSILATANFEFYVNRSPSIGTEAEVQSYYRVATLAQINAELDSLRAELAQLTETIANLESA